MTLRWSIVLTGILLLGSAAVQLAARAEGDKKDEPKNGTTIGILVNKGPTWVEVKADGEKDAVRYLPYWRGGAPTDGGGPDKTVVETIKKIPVTNLVKVAWELNENHRRIVTIEIVIPDKKDGDVTGAVVGKGDAWLDVKPQKDGPAERYMARWSGGLPKDGGGYEKAILDAIKALTVGDTVHLTWKYDERKRVLTLEKIATPKETPK